jgi:hypothetical protein
MKNRWEQYKEKNGSTLLDALNPNTKPASKEIADQRYSVCKLCSRFISATTQCKECSCFMPLKVKIEKSKCPIGNW